MNDNQDPNQIQPTVMPITEPIAAPVIQEPQTPTHVETKTPKKGKKALIIGVIVAILGLGLIGGSALAYTAYTTYQEPENVLLDTASKLMSMQKMRTKTVVTSDVSYDFGGKKITLQQLTYDSGIERAPSMDTNAELKLLFGDMPLTVKADVLINDEGILFVRVSNIQDTIKKILGDSTTISAELEALVDKIDGKWAKYALNDLTAGADEYSDAVQCTLDVYKKYKDDPKATQEFVEAYRANQFVVLDGEPQDRVSEVGYPVKIDDKKYFAFMNAIKLTTMAQEQFTCHGIERPTKEELDKESYNDDGAEVFEELGLADYLPRTTTTLWITKYSHKLRAIDSTAVSPKVIDGSPISVTTRVEISDDQGVVTQQPNQAMSLEEWGGAASDAVSELLGLEDGASLDSESTPIITVSP